MSKFGEQIRSSSVSHRNRIEVPEWGNEDEPMVIYSSALLAGEFNRLQKKHPDFLNNMTIEGLVDLIIMKGQDEHGEKCFDIGDKPILMRQPVSIVSTVAGALMGEINSIEDAEKN